MREAVFPGDVFLDAVPIWLFYLGATALGLAGGSFLNVVIYRLPRGESLSQPGSHCPHCQAPIAPYDNVPVVAWLWLGGKSRCCKQRISPRYPLVELIGGLLAACIVLTRIEPSHHELYASQAIFLFVVYLTLALGLVAAAAIDWEHMILPDSITWGGTVLGLATAPWRPDIDWAWALLGASGGFVGIWFPFIWLHEKLRGFAGMGLGDAKLMALAGAWFGPWGALLTLFAAAVQGTLFTLFVYLTVGKLEEPEAVTRQREELLAAIELAVGEEKEALEKELRDDPLGLPPDQARGGPRVAFGPFLAVSVIELLLFQQPLMTLVRNHFLL